MKALRWILSAAFIAFLSLWGCEDAGNQEGRDTTVIEDREPDVIIEQDDDPDITIDEDDGLDAEIDVDDGKVEGKVRVED
jgi:hypothetical protein